MSRRIVFAIRRPVVIGKVNLPQQELGFPRHAGAESRTESFRPCASIPKQEFGAFRCEVKITFYASWTVRNATKSQYRRDSMREIKPGTYIFEKIKNPFGGT